MLSGLEHLRTHEYVGQLFVDAEDRTTKGAVTPVKSQNNVARVGRFRTTGSLEGDGFITNDNLSHLSGQQLMGCDTVDSACNGGLMDNDFAFAEKNGLRTETSYSYTTIKGTCDASSCIVGITREVSRDTRTCSPTASMLQCGQWHRNPCPSPSREISPRFNRTRQVC